MYLIARDVKMQLNKDDIQNIVIGSSVLGTGGGGRYTLAQKIAQGISHPIKLQPLDKVGKNELIITTFMVGGLKKKGDLGTGIAKSIRLLKETLNKDISYLIPVEVGPTAVVNILNIASELNLPVIDGDLVGFRSAPEIYVEAITLNNTNRLPIVAVNLEGDTIILKETSTIEKIETILRSFSAQSQTEVYVAGYPIYKKQIENFFGNGSLTLALKIGKCLTESYDDKDLRIKLEENGLLLIDSGIIVAQDDEDTRGFTKGKLQIKTKKDLYEVIYKNEYLVLLKNNKAILTSPDSIILVDPTLKRGLNNSEDNRNKRVFIFAKKAIPAWRTPKGKRLFSPKNLGYNYPQKLL